MLPAQATRRGHVHANAALLYYEDRGAGPTLLLIPGGTVDSTHHTAVAERLARRFRVVTYDRRGNGRSSSPAGWPATTITEQADDAAALIEALGLAPCAVWGGSLGGVVLLELLVRRPGLVRAAVVHEPPLFGALADGEPAAGALLASAANAVRQGKVREALHTHARQAIGEPFDRLPAAAIERMVTNAHVFFDLEVPALVDYHPEPTRLRRVALHPADIPVTIMGDPDNAAALPVRAARRLAEQLGTTLWELPGGHMPYATEPVATAAELEAVITAG